MTTTVLPQLQEIASELAAQEETLTARLTELREQLRGIRAVMPMFSETADTAVESVTAEESPPLNEPVVEEATVSSDEPEEAPAVEELAVSEAPQPTEKKAATPKKAAAKKAITQKRTATKKATAKKKKDGRAASWQKYTRPGVKNESIPDAVKLILETQPEKDFKIAEVMDALFQEDMPKAQYLKARNRISNVLSGGVRAGDWHRGARSTYRMSAA